VAASPVAASSATARSVVARAPSAGATSSRAISTTAIAASSTSTLQQRAAAISARITADNAEVQALGTKYVDEQSIYTGALRRGRVLTAAINRTEVAVHADHTKVLDAAISAYVSAGSESSLSLFLTGTESSLPEGQAYLRVASNQLSSAISALDDSEHSLTTSRVTEQHLAATEAAALRLTSADRASVLATVARDQRLLSSIQGQLAVLVHEQEVAAERAAAIAQAAAERAAAKAAAQKAASATATTTGTVSSPAGASGPPAGSSSTSSDPIPAGTIADDFAGIRNCESSDVYTLDTGNGYYGAYQFSLGTWEGLGQQGLPSSNPPAVQDGAAYKLYLGSGWSPWPACAAILGLS